ncbi:MAG TPA: hypothetical protein VLM40_17715, partial [Gemmata sp.]|nr:hypothetical protein [Gemmata sp.]
KGEWKTQEGTNRQTYVYVHKDPAAYEQAKSEFWSYNWWGAGIVCFWLTLMFLFMLGFTYSFFWSAATMIYFLMRKRVDEAELDEVYTEEEELEPPPAPPKLAEGTGTPPAAGTSLPVISPPPPPAPPPTLPPIPVAESPPSPPAAPTIPFGTPPSDSTAGEEPKKPD